MTTKRLVRIAFFTMLTIVGGLIRIPIPYIPISLQTVFVILSGMVLGGRDGAFAQLAYMALGLIGLPVFTSGGGFSYVLKPTFGYILSFPITAFTAGALVRRLKTLNSFKLFACAFAGVLCNYAVGIAYQVAILILYTKSTVAAAFGTVPNVLLMLIKDAVLVYVICLLYPRIMKLVGKLDEVNKPIGDPDNPVPPEEEPQEGEQGDDEQRNKKKPKEPIPEPSPARNHTAPEPDGCK